MADLDELLADVINRRRARPWLHVTPDGMAHFYVRTESHSTEDVDVIKALRAALVVQPELKRVGCLTGAGIVLREHFGRCEKAGHQAVYIKAVAGSTAPEDRYGFDLCWCPMGAVEDDPIIHGHRHAGSATPEEDT